LKRVVFVPLAAILIGAASLEPLRVESYCKGGRHPNLQAMIRVLRAFEDGTQYKSPSGPFEYRPAEDLSNWGGAVGYWPSEAFNAPRTIEPNRGHWRPYALAIPDDGGSHLHYPHAWFRHRMMWLGWRSGQNKYVWSRQSSTDMEDVCK